MAQDALGVRITDGSNLDAVKVLTGATKTLAISIHDGTTQTNVIAANNAVKTDTSSVGGTNQTARDWSVDFLKLNNVIRAEDAAAVSADTGIGALVLQLATPANQATDGDYAFLQMNAGRLWVSATIDAALPTGTNNIGKVDQGVKGTVGNSWFVQIGDQTNVANVIATTNSLKTDLSSVAGNATITAASGIQKVGISGATGGTVDAAGQNVASPTNEILVGGQFNTTPTTIATGNMSPLQLDSAANLLVKLNAALPTGANTIGKADQGAPNTTANRWPVQLTDGTDLSLITTAGSLQADIFSINQVAVATAASGIMKVGLTDGTGTAITSTGAAIDANIKSWLGSTVPTVGQKTMANSVPVVLASDQGSISVNIAGGPGTEKRNEQTFTALTAQSSTAALTFPASGGIGGTTGKLTQVSFSSDSPVKVIIDTHNGTTAVVLRTFYVEAGQVVNWSPPNEDYYTFAGGALNFWRATVTNNNPSGLGPQASGAVSVHWTEL
ncbi:MAG: hypothetical protein ABIW84_00330 [Ilumatobacteraceae bacterium]